jgi:hypothetical protein
MAAAQPSVLCRRWLAACELFTDAFYVIRAGVCHLQLQWRGDYHAIHKHQGVCCEPPYDEIATRGGCKPVAARVQ